MRSEIRAKSQQAKPSANVEAFTLLTLGISDSRVNSLSDALSQFTAPETLDGAFRILPGPPGYCAGCMIGTVEWQTPLLLSGCLKAASRLPHEPNHCPHTGHCLKTLFRRLQRLAGTQCSTYAINTSHALTTTIALQSLPTLLAT